MDDVWIPLLIRAVITAAVVVTATAVAERSGPFWGSLIAAFPTSAGPAYVMLALKQDAAFVAESAVASLASMAAIPPFVTALVHLAPRTNVVVTLAGGLTAWALFAVPITQMSWTPWTALGLCALVFPFGFWATRTPVTIPPDRPRGTAAWYDIPVRALVVGLFVAGVVTASDALGPAVTGLGSVFPIVFLSLTTILHLRLGGAVAAATMHGALRVVAGMTVALLTLHYAVAAWGSAIGLTLFFAVSFAWAGFLIGLRRAGRTKTGSSV